MDKEFLGYSTLTRNEIQSLIHCAHAVLKEGAETEFLVNGKPATDKDKEDFKNMLGYLESAAKKLTEMVENQSASKN